MKFGFDIHGVIDVKPDRFKRLTNKLKEDGHTIYIITGPKIDKPYRTRRGGNFDNVRQELKQHGVYYDELISILDYNQDKGTDMWKNRGNWYMNEDVWNKSKGLICDELEIDFHIDDTLIYRDSFKTPFAFINNETDTMEIFDDINKEVLNLYKDELGYKIKKKN